jgi:hypothetical protein
LGRRITEKATARNEFLIYSALSSLSFILAVLEPILYNSNFLLRMEPNYGDNLEPIAVIGMACRFAGDASSIEKFWDMMNSGAHGASPIPENRFNADAWYHPNHERRGAV